MLCNTAQHLSPWGSDDDDAETEDTTAPQAEDYGI